MTRVTVFVRLGTGMVGGEAARIRAYGGVVEGWLGAFPPFSCLPRFFGMPKDHFSVEEVDVQTRIPIVEARKDMSAPNQLE